MGRQPKLTEEVKVKIIERYFQGESPSRLEQIYGFESSSLRVWVKKYQKDGIAGLANPRKNRSYSREFKKQVVEDYQSGAGSALDLAIKYGIPSPRTVSSWIKQYNGHEDTLKSYQGGPIRMTKGRKTTLAERIEIVEYCIEHKLDYTKTAEQFQVSYTQVYSWVKKYNELGVSALRDNRGKGKPLEDMNELERLQAEFKLMEAKNKQLQMENDVLKKIQELERGRSSVFTDKKQNI
jgi:transposase-like protein